jgi:hypothetical protein
MATDSAGFVTAVVMTEILASAGNRISIVKFIAYKIPGPRFETGASKTRSVSATHHTVTFWKENSNRGVKNKK